MTSHDVVWSYALAPDVTMHESPDGTLLRSAAGQMGIEPAEVELAKRLADGGCSHAELSAASAEASDAAIRGAALLFRLDQAGLLTRRLSSGGRRLASCIPLRAAPGPQPHSPPEGPLVLSPHAMVRIEPNAIAIEAPGAWARMTLDDRHLLPLLHDLSVDRSLTELTAALPSYSADAIHSVLALMRWCDVLDSHVRHGWPAHDLLFHTHTRAGYARTLRGKIGPRGNRSVPSVPLPAADTSRIPLERPDVSQLRAQDPPHAVVAERRRSIREHGSPPLTIGQLSEFLFRTLHERNGWRPYPSAGSCYPLNAYLAVHRCDGLSSGLYAYDPVAHELITVAEPSPTLDRLLADAAGAAAVERPPQILVVLAAQHERSRRSYPDISYNLILKEVGAVFQTAMMAAAAMGLASCPLGGGNTLLFAALTGLDPMVESSVGELMLGSPAD